MMSNPAATHRYSRYSSPAVGDRSLKPSFTISVPISTADRVTSEPPRLRIISSSTNVIHVSDPRAGMMMPTSQMKKSVTPGFLIVSVAIATP